MTDKVFIDTNIIVYAYDKHEPTKQARAQEILKSAIEDESAALSVQVFGEFFMVATRRIKEPLSTDDAEMIVDILSVLPVVEIDFTMVKRAIQTHCEYGISYWDALIVSAAERVGCKKILSEDLDDGQYYHGVCVENPFTELF